MYDTMQTVWAHHGRVWEIRVAGQTAFAFNTTTNSSLPIYRAPKYIGAAFADLLKSS